MKITDYMIENDIVIEDVQSPPDVMPSFLKSLYLNYVEKYGYTEEGCSKANRLMEEYYGSAWERSKEEVWQWLDDVKLIDKKSERDLWQEERRLALEETKNIHKWGKK
jgi:hypothetical protein